MKAEQLPVLVVVVPLLCAYLVPVIGWYRKKYCYPYTVAVTFATTSIAFMLLLNVLRHGTMHYKLGGWAPPWGIEYVVDALNAFMLTLVSFISFLIAIYSRQSVLDELPGKIAYFYTIFLMLMVGLLGIVVTGDMFNLYVFLEIASLSAYALIAIGEDGAPLASFNYIIMGTIGACFYLLGVGYCYISTGSLNLEDLSRRLPHIYQSRVVIVASVFFAVGLGLKIGLFPLHVWLPDAYTRAPSVVSAYIAPLMTKVGAYVLVRVLFKLFHPSFSFGVLPLGQVLTWLATIGIIYGSIMAIPQNDLKRMLAYSSVSQIGYIVLGLALNNRTAMVGALLHILNHAFMKGCLFMVAGSIMLKLGTRDIDKLRFLHRKMPYTSAALAIAALSMIGVPPTGGFFSKLYLILGAVEEHKLLFAGVILISSLLNIVYFFRVIEFVFFEPKTEVAAGHNPSHHYKVPVERMEAPISMLAPMWVLVAGIILLGLLNYYIVQNILEYAVPIGM